MSNNNNATGPSKGFKPLSHREKVVCELCPPGKPKIQYRNYDKHLSDIHPGATVKSKGGKSQPPVSDFFKRPEPGYPVSPHSSRPIKSARLGPHHDQSPPGNKLSPARRGLSPAPRERDVFPVPRDLSPAPREPDVSPVPHDLSPVLRDVSPIRRDDLENNEEPAIVSIKKMFDEMSLMITDFREEMNETLSINIDLFSTGYRVI